MIHNNVRRLSESHLISRITSFTPPLKSISLCLFWHRLMLVYLFVFPSIIPQYSVNRIIKWPFQGRCLSRVQPCSDLTCVQNKWLMHTKFLEHTNISKCMSCRCWSANNTDIWDENNPLASVRPRFQFHFSSLPPHPPPIPLTLASNISVRMERNSFWALLKYQTRYCMTKHLCSWSVSVIPS